MGRWFNLSFILLLLETTVLSVGTATEFGNGIKEKIHFSDTDTDLIQAGFPYIPPPNISPQEIDSGFYSRTVDELRQKIETTPGWVEAFETAISNTISTGIDMQGVSDLSSWFEYLTRLLVWMPSEEQDGKFMYNKFALLGFIFDQPSILALPDSRNPISPSQFRKPKRYLTDWLVRYSRSLGAWLDSPESISPETVETFRNTASFHVEDYIEPEGGWKTFNEFFARQIKPGKRPIAGLNDSRIIIQPADSVYDGAWPINSNVDVVIKGVPWPIQELLNGSRYTEKFKDGMFTHSFLNINDYHRQHAPISGTVLEVKNIDGYAAAFASVVNSNKTEAVKPSNTTDINLLGITRGRGPNSSRHPSALSEEGFPEHEGRGKPELCVTRRLQLDDEAGFQFLQLRGLIVIESKELGGLMAVLPIGMGQCSSVVITVNEGDDLKKGDEISYFQFGGSDVVMIFSKDMDVQMIAQEGVHYNMGEAVAIAGGSA